MFRYYRNGFTLIELLSSIAIIAVLLAIIIPMTKGMIEKSQKAACSSNMRQVFFAVQAYANDHDGQIIASLGGGPRPEGLGYWVWTRAIEDYLDSPGKVPSKGSRPRGVFACPSSDATVRSGATSDYAINGHVSLGKSGERFQSLVDPAATICLIEAKNEGSNTCCREVAWWLGDGQMGINFQHNSTANTVFFDGHVESLSPDQIPMGRAAAKKRPWALNPL